MATIIFVLYFFTEWCPIFVIYLAHAIAFKGLLKRERLRMQSEVTIFNGGSERTVTVEYQRFNKLDEFRMLLAM
jgi:hypothetical protein